MIMRSYIFLTNVFFLSFATTAYPVSQESIDISLQDDILAYSKHIGYTIAEDLKIESEYIDIEAVIEGMREYSQGKLPAGEPSSMIPNASLASIQKRLFETQARTNLEQTEKYLQELCEKPSVHVLEKSALAYEVLERGQGGKALTENDTIVVRYLILDSEGRNVFSQDEETSEELESTCQVTDFLPSISRALVGMTLGERRKIYVHPRLAYGELSQLPPNTLLIVDISLLEIKK